MEYSGIHMVEIFDIVDENDNVIGQRPRSDVHGNPGLIHRVVHVLVFDSQGHYLMQKRSLKKDIQPGKWDTSVGGHVDSGESYEEAVIREMQEELGIGGIPLRFLYRYKHSNTVESEMVSTYTCIYDGPFSVQPAEIDEIRFWTEAQIQNQTDLFTPNFLDEILRYKKFMQVQK